LADDLRLERLGKDKPAHRRARHKRHAIPVIVHKNIGPTAAGPRVIAEAL